MSKPLPQHVAVIDLETTGLGPDAMILEAGLIIADLATLDPIVETSWVVGTNGLIGHATMADLRATCDPVVQDMHDRNGLWREVQASTVTIDDVHAQMADVLRRFPGPLAVAGSGVDRFDRPLLNRDMPDVVAQLLYWSFDVSSIRRLASLAGRDDLLMAGTLDPPHRALGDCRLHMAELAHWRDIFADHVDWSTIR